jgi:hypothetical protein
MTSPFEAEVLAQALGVGSSEAEAMAALARVLLDRDWDFIRLDDSGLTFMWDPSWADTALHDELARLPVTTVRVGIGGATIALVGTPLSERSQALGLSGEPLVTALKRSEAHRFGP